MNQHYACVSMQDGTVLESVSHKPHTNASAVFCVDGMWMGEIWSIGKTEMEAIQNALGKREKIMEKSDVL